MYLQVETKLEKTHKICIKFHNICCFSDSACKNILLRQNYSETIVKINYGADIIWVAWQRCSGVERMMMLRLVIDQGKVSFCTEKRNTWKSVEIN